MCCFAKLPKSVLISTDLKAGLNCLYRAEMCLVFLAPVFIYLILVLKLISRESEADQ